MMRHNLSKFLRPFVSGRPGRLLCRLFPGTPIWEHEWDVCCILDGCRSDVLKSVAGDGHDALPSPDSVETLWSVGSQTAEWMDTTFSPRYQEKISRTGYITGNPFSSQTTDHILATSGDVLPLNEDDFGLLYEAWRSEWVDGDISTIPPDPITEAAIAIWRRREEFDIDRLIVHYMQPHAPFRSCPHWFLGDAEVESWGKVDENEHDGTSGVCGLSDEEIQALEALEDDTDGPKDVWTRLRDGDLPQETFWHAYKDNLHWVLDDISRLLENCDASFVITSDHGNAAGEFGVWSHPPGVPIPTLRRVPWVRREGTDKETIHPATPDFACNSTKPESEERKRINDRLTSLGYF